MTMPAGRTVAELVVDFLIARGVDRVFGLQGGHIQPIWDQLGQRGVRIVDVRDEGAAVHMAHAHAVLTGGVGIAMVTAGPGVTNCVTAMANAQLERVPVLLIGGCAPRRAGRPRSAAGHRARRHHAAGHARRRARCASPTTCCATSTRRTRPRPATAIRPARSTSKFPTDVLRKTVRAEARAAASTSTRSRARRIPPDARMSSAPRASSAKPAGRWC